MNAPDRAAARSPNRIALALAFAAGLLIGLWLLFEVKDQHDRGIAAVQWLDDTIDVRRQRSANLDAYTQDVAAVRKDLAVLQQRLPAQFPATDIEAGLRALTAQHGIELLRLVSGRERLRDFYASLDYTLELRGTAPQLQAFFRDYADIVPLQRTTRVRLSSAGSPDSALMAEVSTDYYRFIEEGETRR